MFNRTFTYSLTVTFVVKLTNEIPEKTSAYEFYWVHSCMFVYKRLFLRNTNHRCNIVLGLWWAFIMKIYVEARDAWHKGASHEISNSEIQMSLNCLVSFSFRKCLRIVAGCLVGRSVVYWLAEWLLVGWMLILLLVGLLRLFGYVQSFNIASMQPNNGSMLLQPCFWITQSLLIYSLWVYASVLYMNQM